LYRYRRYTLEVGPSDVLCDLGSGRGQVVLEAAAQGICSRAVGVELVPARAALAQKAWERLSDHPSVKERAVLIEGDMFFQRTALDAIEDATCVFCANTAFAPGLNDMLANLLGDREVRGSSAGGGGGSGGGGGGGGGGAGEGAGERGGGGGGGGGGGAATPPPRMPRLRVAALTARLPTAAAAAARLRWRYTS
jgi:hypothetical protein